MEKREIKFRAWDLENKEMLHWYEIFNSHTLLIYIFKYIESVELMQFTGLHDKNGKEIYEGDIIDDGLHSNIIIGWCKELGSFVLTRKGWAFRHWFGESCDPEKVEIIGNIYENPNLIP
jgi:uncharacterized phage protein (TIGR01671 family)